MPGPSDWGGGPGGWSAGPGGPPGPPPPPGGFFGSGRREGPGGCALPGCGCFGCLPLLALGAVAVAVSALARRR